MLLFLAALLLGAFLLYTKQTIPVYKPQEIIFETSQKAVLEKDTLTILTWNIGYAGLGADMDFFYDGGSRMQTSKERTISNLAAITKTLDKYSYADFIILQEVDINSKRSYGINQEISIGKNLNQFSLFFAPNYEVELVPMPLTSPLGQVNSGLLTLTKYTPSSAIRYSYPDKHPFPEGLFMPKRCFLALRFPLSNGKHLMIINTHNSAYDSGELRKMEMNQLKHFVEREYKNGNYVVVGGDWNQNPPTYNQQNIDINALEHFKPAIIPDKLMGDGWKWISDPHFDSNRFLNRPYIKGKTMTTTLDFFLVSPNIRALDIKTINNGFKHSDHQPILIKLTLSSSAVLL